MFMPMMWGGCGGLTWGWRKTRLVGRVHIGKVNHRCGLWRWLDLVLEILDLVQGTL